MASPSAQLARKARRRATGSGPPPEHSGATPCAREAPRKQMLFGPLPMSYRLVLPLQAQSHQEGVSEGQLRKARGERRLKVPHLAGSCIKLNIGCPSYGRINGIGDADGLRTSGPAQSKTLGCFPRASGRGNPQRDLSLVNLCRRRQLHMGIIFNERRHANEAQPSVK